MRYGLKKNIGLGLASAMLLVGQAVAMDKVVGAAPQYYNGGYNQKDMIGENQNGDGKQPLKYPIKVMTVKVSPGEGRQNKLDAIINGAAVYLLRAEEENIGVRIPSPSDLITENLPPRGSIYKCPKVILERENQIALGVKIGRIPSSMDGDVDIKTNAYVINKAGCPYQDVLDLKARIWSNPEGTMLYLAPTGLNIVSGRDRRYRL
ncbi:hypothetical protein CSR02_14450 [Acetobacter pomorum]|uniref:Uncharacterized protein n=2 Tax=Acetobacter TaxID=434 RepID=A0A401WYC7_ACEPA|nr:hypothetical protein CSR02_14450 [Acetobacter pomorum]GBR52435.1 hypothetical protein AA11825_2237 [Acetobacter pomorum DSM 11825]GCD54284.1 hypothetical protein NBRC3188_2981 [Acetobacter pasteurianus NBRC 3188]